MTTIDEIKEAIKKDYVPNGIYSFNELDGFRTAQKKVQEAYSTLDDFMGLIYSIVTSPEIVDKAERIIALSRELEARVVTDASETYEMEKAVWSTAKINDLPDSSFLYIESGGKKDGDGKTTPRSLRHFPYKDETGAIDLPHLRNAIARIPQADIPDDLKEKLQAKARKLLGGEKTEKSWNAILKAMDGEKRLAYGVVLKPDVVDAQGDIMTQDDIEKAAHDFFINSRIMDLQHTEDLPSDRAVPVESYIAPQDMVVGGNKIAKGSWVMVTHVPDEAIWTQIKKGRIMAYSIRGLGKRTPIE